MCRTDASPDLCRRCCMLKDQRTSNPVPSQEGEHLTIVAYAGAMMLVYPFGTPALYWRILTKSRYALGQIRRAELTAAAERTTLAQRRLSTTASSHWDVHEEAGNKGRRRWEVDDAGGEPRASMAAAIDTQHDAAERAARLRSELPAAAWKLTDGNLGEVVDLSEANARLEAFEVTCSEKLAEEEAAAAALAEKKAEKAAKKKK